MRRRVNRTLMHKVLKTYELMDELRRFLGIVMPSERGEIKGVVLVKYEDSTKKILTKAVYLRMKNSGRKIVLLREGLHWEDLL